MPAKKEIKPVNVKITSRNRNKKKTDSEQEKKSGKFYRTEKNRVIAGVAGGLGEYFKIDPTLVRLAFILLTIFGGSGILIYIIFWLVMPSESDILSSQTQPSVFAADFKKGAERLSSDFKRSSKENSRFWWGVLAIVIGFLFLFNNFGIWEIVNISEFWPVALIALGLVLLLRKV